MHLQSGRTHFEESGFFWFARYSIMHVKLSVFRMMSYACAVTCFAWFWYKYLVAGFESWSLNFLRRCLGGIIGLHQIFEVSYVPLRGICSWGGDQLARCDVKEEWMLMSIAQDD